MASSKPQDPFFKSLGALAEDTDQLPDSDDEKDKAAGVNADGKATEEVEDDRPMQEIESLCMHCGQQGVTRMLLTNIPYFREVIIMSFRCEFCGESNNEVMPAGQIKDQGTLYTAKVLKREDLSRQIVKSPTATVILPEFELTIPPKRGQLTTVEGLIRTVIEDLSTEQPLRKIQDPPTYAKIETLLSSLHASLLDDAEGEPVSVTKEGGKISESEPVPNPFTVKLDDPAGNSWIEFLGGSMAHDSKWNMRQYHRTREQNVMLGLAQADDQANEEYEAATANAKTHRRDDLPKEAIQALQKAHAGGDDDDDEIPTLKNEEIYIFPGFCSSCSAPLDTMMKRVTIPYFQDIFIMSTNCDKCGYRDNEVKSGGAISEKGKKITLKVEDIEDLARDVLKSESCGLEIPEIDLVLQPGTLGGRFSTLEGLLTQVHEELSEKAFATGDAKDATQGSSEFEVFLGRLKEVMTASIPFTVILNDPLSNSYLQNIYAPDPDPNMTTETYERTWEQNEELGLNDMKVEGYEEDHAAEVAAEKAEAEAVAQAVRDAKAASATAV
ncbi:nucleolar zinc-finger protein [Tulasnella sp. JGI-2019a]|nr:nucleolar zinc-finger protein [Tulasnella sp. JGI-2019a]KAG9018367.1 nucleolar zinc-finger protein [Tulasnella sp. JGI-2019a]KAG9037580.1 nucleolar zinc-finger protein [Tulasnella sp. JGI-2019a]